MPGDIAIFWGVGNQSALDRCICLEDEASMDASLHQHAGLSIIEYPSEGDLLAALDIIGETYGQGVDWVAVPTTRLPAEFFRLRSGILGEFTQKFVNYGLKLAVVGDISSRVEASEAFRAYVVEANRGSNLWFAPDLPALLARLDRAHG
jgi:hypothetical protein